MFLTEQNGTQMWTNMLKENFNVTDAEKLNWVSQYAAIHEIHESAQGTAVAVNPIYATPLNTTGMGNPAAPGAPAMGGSQDFFKQAVGSGDIPVSTLPMALNVALLTIGLELLPVIPAKAPWAMLTYMDFPYAGGKLGRTNEVAKIDGVGEGDQNKPLYFKVLGITDEVRNAIRGNEEKSLVFESTTLNKAKVEATFKCFGRMDGGVIAQVKSVTDAATTDPENISLVDAFTIMASTGYKVTVNNSSTPVTVETTNNSIKVDFAQTSVDFVDGFANFATGEKRSMTRAENETGTGNVIGLRLFSKWIQMGSYEVTGTVTRQQLQDLPIYGVDAVAKVMEALQNEITQSINARILEHVFALGVTNAVQQYHYSGVNLNLSIGANGGNSGTPDVNVWDAKAINGKGVNGEDLKALLAEVKDAEANTSAENLHTRQRRVASRLLAAANLIQVTGRRGRATWAVMSAQMASTLQDVSGYVVAPMANNMAQDGSQNLFLNGTYAGLKIYVDPYMDWNDTRICIGRKGNGNEPGAVFMPYILADSVSITAEGTMAPKMLVNSRYAIADAGFYPEKMYLTICCANKYGWI